MQQYLLWPVNTFECVKLVKLPFKLCCYIPSVIIDIFWSEDIFIVIVPNIQIPLIRISPSNALLVNPHSTSPKDYVLFQ